MMKSTRFSTWNLFSTMLLILVLLGWSGGLAQAADKVNTGNMPYLSFVPLYVAVEKGYFTEQNIEVKLVRFFSGAKMVAPMVAGELAVGAAAPSAGLYNAVAQGTGFRIVADKGQDIAGSGYSSIIVRNDLLDSGKVKSIKDLKGMMISHPSRGNLATYYIGVALKANGLTYNDIKTVNLSPPKVVPALKNKSIAASLMGEPWPTIAESRGVARRIFNIGDVPGIEAVQNGMIIYTDKFMKERPEVAQRWMNAYVKGIRYYNKRGLKNEEIMNILGKYMRTPKKVMMKAADHPFYLDQNGKPNVKSIMQIQSFFHELGLVKKMVTANQLIDLRFLPK